MKNIFRIVFFFFFFGGSVLFLFRAFLCFSFCLFSILDTFCSEQSVSVFVGILIFCTLFYFFPSTRLFGCYFSFLLHTLLRLAAFWATNEMITKIKQLLKNKFENPFLVYIFFCIFAMKSKNAIFEQEHKNNLYSKIFNYGKEIEL